MPFQDQLCPLVESDIQCARSAHLAALTGVEGSHRCLIIIGCSPNSRQMQTDSLPLMAMAVAAQVVRREVFVIVLNTDSNINEIYVSTLI